MKTWLKTCLTGGFFLGIIYLLDALNYKFPETGIRYQINQIIIYSYYILIFPLSGILTVAWDPLVQNPIDGVKRGAISGIITSFTGLGLFFTSSFAIIQVRLSSGNLGNFSFGAISTNPTISFPPLINNLGRIIPGSLLSLLIGPVVGAIGGFLYSTIKNKNEAA